MKTLQLAVSEFALPSPRTGSIETYSGFGGLPNVGSALHLEVQMARIQQMPGYTPEKWITHSFEHGDYRIVVSGRMDGFLFGSPVLIEEIKSAYNIEDLKRALQAHPDHPYKLQLRTYGYLQWLNTQYEPKLNLHLVNARTRQAEDIALLLERENFEAWLKRRLTEITEDQQRFDVKRKRRKKMAQSLAFPFSEPRPGQRELMAHIQAHLGSDRRLLLQAPTGLGKTAGVLFPVMQEAMARGQKTLYLTAKNSQHEVAEDAARRLQVNAKSLRSVSVHAKAKMCLKDEPHCHPEHCEFAKDHYRKTAQAGLAEQLAKKKHLSAKTFKKLGQENEVCPFELQFEAIPYADLIICDYNYVFSPRNSLGRLLHNGWRAQSSRPNLVIDEVHNLPARATDYFSATLSCETLRDLAAQAPLSMAMMAQEVLRSLRELLLSLDGEGPRQIQLSAEKLEGVQTQAQELLARYLESELELQRQDPIIEMANLVSTFMQALEAVEDEFFLTLSPSPSGGVLRLTCCDASAALRQSYAHFQNVVGFSATLKPFSYYAQLLGMDGENLSTAEFDSPFPAQNRKLLVIPQISTKMRDRQRNFAKIKETIERILSVKEGNYFVFFPSFDFMMQVRQLVELPQFRILVQDREMRREAVASYIEQLKEKIPTVIFAVQGGAFAEGVDYPGEMLIGALIVGPALPVFDFERELLRAYFERKHGQGFDYAYTYPAMARVVQSAGRVIRSAKDRGLIVLMDRRFLQESFKKSMPKDWQEQPMISQQILHDVRQFWKNHES